MSLLRDGGTGGRRAGHGPGGYGKLAPVRVPAPGTAGPRALATLGRRPSLRERALAKDSPLRHVDWTLVVAVLVLALLGTALVWAATRQADGGTNGYLFKQLLNVVIGVVLMAGVSLIDYRLVRAYSPLIYGLTCLGLLVVLSPLGTTVYGAHSWISLPGGYQVEPSEFAKLGLVLMTAVFLSEVADRRAGPRLRQVVLALLAGAFPVLLVLLQPDLGVVILMLVVLIGMIALSGLRLRWLAALTGAGVVGGLAGWHLHLLKAYQVQRLTSFLHPSSAPSAAGYNALQSKVMVGSGGMFGQGLFHGQLVAGNFVPNQQTDFIFAVAGEELGFVGAITIVVLIGWVVLRAVRIAARADDAFGTLVASGIAIWFAFQSFINVGMTIGVAPVTGLPLPFVSYGGSAMFADMIAVGMLLAVHRRHRVFG